jgi:hypothetical protein
MNNLKLLVSRKFNRFGRRWCKPGGVSRWLMTLMLLLTPSARVWERNKSYVQLRLQLQIKEAPF